MLRPFATSPGCSTPSWPMPSSGRTTSPVCFKSSAEPFSLQPQMDPDEKYFEQRFSLARIRSLDSAPKQSEARPESGPWNLDYNHPRLCFLGKELPATEVFSPLRSAFSAVKSLWLGREPRWVHPWPSVVLFCMDTATDFPQKCSAPFRIVSGRSL